nr:MAG TPA: hypothetical protein [Caudoviricetes sp.]DAP36341.1 MAG TPA: hypothetical protein [Caudoviricetes sp.]DAQ69155.1 MAG TPA: hypothetical protein [Caudoviricetes sp.]
MQVERITLVQALSGFTGCKTGGAWLSSARVVRCWVKSRNNS